MATALKDRCRGISLGLFAGALTDLADEAEAVQAFGADILHFDVMDGVFVPQFTGGPGFLKGLAGPALRDAHLMIARPADHVAEFVKASADILTIHVESEAPGTALKAARQAAEAQNRDLIAGFAIMPATPLDELKPLFAQAPDIVLVLALDPRDGAPPDIARACARVTALRDLLPDALIAFDGGVTEATAAQIAPCAPDIVVSGSAIMKATDRATAFQNLTKQLARA